MELTMPDEARCQAEIPNGAGPFTVGGVPARVRCSRAPAVVVTETSPGSDGERGSMALCADCLGVFRAGMPDGYATEETITTPTGE